MLFKNTNKHETILLIGIVAVSTTILVVVSLASQRIMTQLSLQENTAPVIDVVSEDVVEQVIEVTPEARAAFIEKISEPALAEDTFTEDERADFMKKIESSGVGDETSFTEEERSDFLKKLHNS